jgi:hypothetical protein
MRGTLTMPDLLSPASPARFWAWLRYYLAPTIASDLRITLDFAGLDPHQKGILSDDFGVALSTQLYRSHKRWREANGGARAGNPHAACDVEGTGNVAWSR